MSMELYCVCVSKCRTTIQFVLNSSDGSLAQQEEEEEINGFDRKHTSWHYHDQKVSALETYHILTRVVSGALRQEHKRCVCVGV